MKDFEDDFEEDFVENTFDQDDAMLFDEQIEDVVKLTDDEFFDKLEIKNLNKNIKEFIDKKRRGLWAKYMI